MGNRGRGSGGLADADRSTLAGMTEGHKHRQVTVKRGGLIDGLLRRPVWWSSNIEKVDRSPYPYGPDPAWEGPPMDAPRFYLSALSVLHRWTGLTLWVEDERP